MTGEMLSPVQLYELESRVQKRLNGRVRNLRLSLRENGLVLEGQTQSYYVKQLAQHAIMEAIDLPISANEIEVPQLRSELKRERS
jgi:hypothetical protein